MTPETAWLAGRTVGTAAPPAGTKIVYRVSNGFMRPSFRFATVERLHGRHVRVRLTGQTTIDLVHLLDVRIVPT